MNNSNKRSLFTFLTIFFNPNITLSSCCGVYNWTVSKTLRNVCRVHLASALCLLHVKKGLVSKWRDKTDFLQLQHALWLYSDLINTFCRKLISPNLKFPRENIIRSRHSERVFLCLHCDFHCMSGTSLSTKPFKTLFLKDLGKNIITITALYTTGFNVRHHHVL